jgi:hypothetical protein
VARKECPGVAYRAPTELENAFLRVVTRGYSNLESQIASCEVADYDPVGFVHVRTRIGPPQPSELGYVNGPDLLSSTDGVPTQTILFVGDAGMLYLIDIVEFRLQRLPDPYSAFVQASLLTPSSLAYHSPKPSL